METDNIISKASSGTTGPRGSELPIIASSMVIDIKTLVMPDGKTADYTPLATAMDEFKECGFNSFIARLDYDYMNTLLKGALSLAQAKNLFIIIVSDALDAPSAALLNLWDKNTPTINGADKAKAYKDNFDGRISGFLKICGSYNSFGGVSLTDEPTLSQLKQRYNPEPNKLYFGDFATTEGSYYCLSNRYQIVRTAINKNSSISGNVVIMVNLVGIHETPTHIEGAAYEDYLSAYSNLPGISGQQPYL